MKYEFLGTKVMGSPNMVWQAGLKSSDKFCNSGKGDSNTSKDGEEENNSEGSNILEALKDESVIFHAHTKFAGMKSPDELD